MNSINISKAIAVAFAAAFMFAASVALFAPQSDDCGQPMGAGPSPLNFWDLENPTVTYDGEVIIRGVSPDVSGDITLADGVYVSPTLSHPVIGISTEDGATGFQNCSQITSIDLGPAMRRVGDGAFQGCDMLQSVRLPVLGDSNNERINEMTFGNDLFSRFVAIDCDEVQYFRGWFYDDPYEDDPVRVGPVSFPKGTNGFSLDGLTIFPLWKQGYTLTFDDGDGNTETYPITSTERVKLSSVYQGGYEGENKIMTGWADADDGTVYKTGDFFTMPDRNVILEAQWQYFEPPGDTTFAASAAAIAVVAAAALAVFLIASRRS